METADPTLLELHAAWVLVSAFVISLAYEVWRATAKRGTSRHDSWAGLLQQLGTLYLASAVVIALLFLGVTGAEWIALVFSVLIIGVSLFYYNPVVMLERDPGLIDWVEDLTFTGLWFVAAALLLYEVTGYTVAAT